MSDNTPGQSAANDNTKTLIRSFAFVIIEQLPAIESNTIIRKVGIVEVNTAMTQGMSATDPNATITLAEHALGQKPSQFLSFSDSALGSPTNALQNAKGEPLLVDLKKMQQHGVQIFTPEEVVADLRRYVQKNPSEKVRVNKLIDMILDVEREVLVKGHVRSDWVSKPNYPHKSYIGQAENIVGNVRQHRDLLRTKRELAALQKSYKAMRVTGNIFRVVNVAGVVLSVGDVAYAGHQSIQEKSANPLLAETIRQAGGWGSGWLGVKAGCAAGAAVGITTGPGAFVTCAIGGLTGGVAGYFGFDWIADHIYENEPGLPWLNINNW